MIMLANDTLDPKRAQTAPSDTAVRRFRILVVDDNHDAALGLAMVLTMMGHETRTAHDGQTALATAEEFHPHVVLLDIGLPKMKWGSDSSCVTLPIASSGVSGAEKIRGCVAMRR